MLGMRGVHQGSHGRRQLAEPFSDQHGVIIAGHDKGDRGWHPGEAGDADLRAGGRESPARVVASRNHRGPEGGSLHWRDGDADADIGPASNLAMNSQEASPDVPPGDALLNCPPEGPLPMARIPYSPPTP